MAQLLSLLLIFAQTPIDLTNQQYVRLAIVPKGWNQHQWACLHRLVQRESGWRLHADNPHSTAHGLFQILRTDPKASRERQTSAAIRYITKRYQTPCNALAHSLRKGWY